MPLLKKVGLLTAPLLFFIVVNLPNCLVSQTADAVIAVALWMIMWWITEAVHIAVTALLPLILFPLLGVMNASDVGANYGSPIIFLFFGGFVLALARPQSRANRATSITIARPISTDVTNGRTSTGR